MHSNHSLPNGEVNLIPFGQRQANGEAGIDAHWGARADEEVAAREVASDGRRLLFSEVTRAFGGAEAGVVRRRRRAGRGGVGREGIVVIIPVP